MKGSVASGQSGCVAKWVCDKVGVCQSWVICELSSKFGTCFWSLSVRLFFSLLWFCRSYSACGCGAAFFGYLHTSLSFWISSLFPPMSLYVMSGFSSTVIIVTVGSI